MPDARTPGNETSSSPSSVLVLDQSTTSQGIVKEMEEKKEGVAVPDALQQSGIFEEALLRTSAGPELTAGLTLTGFGRQS